MFTQTQIPHGPPGQHSPLWEEQLFILLCIKTMEEAGAGHCLYKEILSTGFSLYSKRFCLEKALSFELLLGACMARLLHIPALTAKLPASPGVGCPLWPFVWNGLAEESSMPGQLHHFPISMQIHRHKPGLRLTCQDRGPVAKAEGSHCWEWKQWFESDSLYVAQAGLEFAAILRPLRLKYSCVMPHLPG